MKFLWLFAAAGWLLMAQQPPAPVATGPDVGTKVPPFEAKDSHGHPQTLNSIMGPKGALLVFFRSADW
jgi:hypothetical protein